MGASPIVVAEGLTRHYRVALKEDSLLGTLRHFLRRRYQTIRAVEGVSFRILPGEVVGFLGPNGAGKTTTLKMLTGLVHPTRGKALVAGHVPWRREKAFLRKITLVMGNKQQLIWDLPAMDSFRLNAAIYEIPEGEFRKRVLELAEMLSLTEKLHQPVRKLSLGERMKAELLAALLHRPEVLFLDEPTLGLDPEAAREFLDLIKGLKAEGITVLLSSHLLHQVQEVCDRVGLFHKGRLALEGTVAELAHRVLGGQYEILLEGAPGLEGALEAVEGVSRVEAEGGRYRVLATRDLRPELARLVVERGPLYALSLRQPSLDEIYAHYFKEVAHAA